MAKQTKTARVAELEAQVVQLQAKIEELEKDVRGEKVLRDMDVTALTKASIDNRFLNDEVAAMEKSHANEVMVHRDVIMTLLNHHKYKPRRFEWVDENGKPIEVKLHRDTEHAIHNTVAATDAVVNAKPTRANVEAAVESRARQYGFGYKVDKRNG